MAEASRKRNVIVTSADGDTITDPQTISGIKVIGGASGITWNLKDPGGNIVYQAVVGNSSSSFDKFEECWHAGAGVFTGNIAAGSGTVYIYVQ